MLKPLNPNAYLGQFKCFEYTAFSKSIDSVDTRNYQSRDMSEAINEIASSASRFSDSALPRSPSAETRLKPLNLHVNDEYVFVSEPSTHQRCSFDSLLNFILSRADQERILQETKEAPDKKLLMKTYVELLMKCIEIGVGNCGEKALLAGIVIKATIKNELEKMGYTQEAIQNANIEIKIFEDDSVGKDHTICYLSYKIDNEQKSLIVDPWIHGSVIDYNDRKEFYIHNVKTDFNPTRFRKNDDQTQFINDEESVNAVVDWIKTKTVLNFSSM